MRFNHEYIRKIINGIHYDHILDRGYAIYQENKVKGYNIENGRIVFFVDGTQRYHVTLAYKDDRSISALQCTCPYQGQCKHTVAVLFYLAENDIRRDGEEEITEDILEKGPVNQFKKLPFAEGMSVKDTLKLLYPTHFNNNYSQYTFVWEYKNDNSLKVDAEPEGYSYYNKTEPFTAEIKRDGKDIFIKCNTCSQVTTKLCNHQYLALQDFAEYKFTEKYVKGEISYEDIIKDFIDSEGLSVSSINRYYRLMIREKHFYLDKKKTNLLSNAELTIHNNYMLTIFSQHELKDTDIFGTEELNEKFQNGFWWDIPVKVRAYSIIPHLIEGKTNKEGTKLVSNIGLTEEYPFFNKKQQEIYHDITSIYDKNTRLSDRLAETELIQYLNENIKTLNSIFNFYGNPYDTYGGLHQREKFKKSALKPFDFKKDTIQINYNLAENPTDDMLYDLKCNITVDGITLHKEAVDVVHPLFLVIGNAAHIYNRQTDYQVIDNYLESTHITFARKNLEKLIPLFNNIMQYYELDIDISEPLETKVLYGGKKQLFFSEIGRRIIIKPFVLFEEVYKQNAMSGFLEEQPDPLIFNVKGNAAKELVEFLKSQHESFDQNNDALDFFTITVEEMLDKNWFLSFFERCKEEKIEVFGMDVLKNFRFNSNSARVDMKISSGIDWFDVDVDIAFGDTHVPLASWVEMVKENEKFVKLSDGSLGIIPEEWLEKLKAVYGLNQDEKGSIKISSYNFNIVDQLFNDMLDEESILAIAEKKKAFEEFEKIKNYKIPKLIVADLRPYQLYGYQWLRFLDEYGFGGCLADDMGLGKTLQMLCLFAYQKEKKDCFNLIIVPNSLIFNWANEIEKFCPSLKYLVHHGPSRDVKIIRSNKYDLIITTYGTATSDIEELKEIPFKYVILDESQAIKNPNSKRYKAMRLLKAENRFVMTGTPIENNTFDLYSQFSFVNPGILGNANQFRRKFAQPIDGNKDEAAALMLKKIVNPYLLRRTKEQVAADLPEKTETILYCEMGTRQKKYYDSVKNDIRNSIKGIIDKKGIKKSAFQILEGMLRLRQICNSPKLIDKKAVEESAKLEVLIEHIMNNNAHKSLVFSQFITMLQLIADELDKMGIRYAYLDGSTKDRMEQVNKFQNDKRIQVFLISLKAGNTGLNLTAADYVYIVDPWWNPAVEAQAIDRTHRIGQENHVFAYKMVCKDSIEDKILKLQEKKKNLADDIIQMDANVFKNLDKDDLLGIFD